MDKSKFAPSPMHGAAYAVVIDKVGGTREIASCCTAEVREGHLKTLTDLRAWARTQTPDVRAAYFWGIDMVEADLRSRLDIFENSRRVNQAMVTLPKPD